MTEPIVLPPALASFQPHVDVAQNWTNWALDQGDPRVKGWLLMNPFHVLAVAAAYLIVIGVLRLLVRTKQQAWNVKHLAMIHNINMVALSSYMVFEVLRQAYINGYSLFGNGVDRTANGDGMARIIHIYFLSKVPEFLDTFIMALKGNHHQITFLHVYHHASIFMVWWVICFYAPGGESYFSAALNSFIHVVMYGYYLWSSFAPKRDDSKKPRWTEPAFYRKYITTMQLTQFCLMMCQSVYDLVFPAEGFPRFCVWILFYYMITMLGLFGNFFIKNYSKKGSKGTKDE